MNIDAIIQRVTDGYVAAADAWRGCEWTTSFGPRRLDLRGLKARQTRLVAEATSGEEAEAWAAATRWLEMVEQRAREARSHAAAAVEHVARREWAQARMRMAQACALEAQFHEIRVWGPLHDLISAASEHESAS